MTIRHHLDGRIIAIPHAKVLRNADTAEAEFPQPFFLHGGHQDGVEVAAGVVTEGEEDLDGGTVVAHCHLDGSAVQRPCGTVGADGGAAAGEGTLLFFVGFAGRGELEGEVSGDEGGEEREG